MTTNIISNLNNITINEKKELSHRETKQTFANSQEN